jgi:hypothetical protein
MGINCKACNTHANQVVRSFRLREPTKQRKTFSRHIMNKLYYVSPSYHQHHHPVNNNANFWMIKLV